MTSGVLRACVHVIAAAAGDSVSRKQNKHAHFFSKICHGSITAEHFRVVFVLRAGFFAKYGVSVCKSYYLRGICELSFGHLVLYKISMLYIYSSFISGFGARNKKIDYYVVLAMPFIFILSSKHLYYRNTQFLLWQCHLT